MKITLIVTKSELISQLLLDETGTEEQQWGLFKKQIKKGF